MKQVHGIWLPDSDTHFNTYITPDATFGGTYQLKKLDRAVEFVKTRGVAIDIGAHVGLWSKVLASRFEHVYAFEPLKPHRDCFARNLEGIGNVTLFGYALSDKSEQLNIRMPLDNTGHSHVAKDYDGDASREWECHAVPLDSLKWPDKLKIDFVKIDVEGWELAVVRGAEETLRKHWPVIIIEQKPHGNAERYGWKQRDALAQLLRWGFKEVAHISGDHILVPA